MTPDLRRAIDTARARLDPTSGDQAELSLLRAEIERLTEENDHFQQAGYRLMATISRIDYAFGEPNEMRVSAYDVDCDDNRVAEAVERMVAERRHSSTDCRMLTGQLNHEYCYLCRVRYPALIYPEAP